MINSLEFSSISKSALEKISEGIKPSADKDLWAPIDLKDYRSEGCNLLDFTEGLIKNKEEGLRRESEVESDLEEEYPESEGYEVVSEAYLRDKDGNIVRDPETGEARRIDFVVIKDGEVVDSVEVTSKTADKTAQTAKEERIRENGGNYVRTKDGTLVEIPSNVKTRIERRD